MYICDFLLYVYVFMLPTFKSTTSHSFSLGVLWMFGLAYLVCTLFHLPQIRAIQLQLYCTRVIRLIEIPWKRPFKASIPALSIARVFAWWYSTYDTWFEICVFAECTVLHWTLLKSLEFDWVVFLIPFHFIFCFVSRDQIMSWKDESNHLTGWFLC